MEALSNQLLAPITFAYMAAAVLYLCFAFFKNRALGLLATTVTVLAFATHTTAIIIRWIASYELRGGLGPFSNLFEALVFFGWALALAYLIVELFSKQRVYGVFAMPLAFGFMLLALREDPTIKPLLPALKSNWLVAHVITCFLGYAAFGLAAVMGIRYLFMARNSANGDNGLAFQNYLIYQTVAVGFILLTAGIVTGSMWANSAWGNYWSWDPKETWSLITWLVYAAFLHARYLAGWRVRNLVWLGVLGVLFLLGPLALHAAGLWAVPLQRVMWFCAIGVACILPALFALAGAHQGKRQAWLAVFGFVCCMFTFFGVNYLAPGMHTYAR